jgi:hypothetical protein
MVGFADRCCGRERRLSLPLTEDLQDGQIVDALTIVNPFNLEPEALLGG